MLLTALGGPRHDAALTALLDMFGRVSRPVRLRPLASVPRGAEALDVRREFDRPGADDRFLAGRIGYASVAGVPLEFCTNRSATVWRKRRTPFSLAPLT